MRRLAVASVLVLAIIAAACTGSDPAFTPSTSTLDGGAGSSDPNDAATSGSDAATGFGAPTVGPFAQVNTADWVEEGASLTPDELTLYYSTNVGGTGGSVSAFKIYTATRATRDVPFDAGRPIDTLVSAAADRWPVVSPDGSVLYFSRLSDRSKTYELWQSMSAGTGWATPSQVPNAAGFPSLGAIAQSTAWLWNATDVAKAPFDEVTGIGPPASDGDLSGYSHLVPTADGSTLFFALANPGHGLDVYSIARNDVRYLRPDRVLVPGVNGLDDDDDVPCAISADGRRLYLATAKPEINAMAPVSGDLRMAERPN